MGFFDIYDFGTSSALVRCIVLFGPPLAGYVLGTVLTRRSPRSVRHRVQLALIGVGATGWMCITASIEFNNWVYLLGIPAGALAAQITKPYFDQLAELGDEYARKAEAARERGERPPKFRSRYVVIASMLFLIPVIILLVVQLLR